MKTTTQKIIIKKGSNVLEGRISRDLVSPGGLGTAQCWLIRDERYMKGRWEVYVSTGRFFDAYVIEENNEYDVMRGVYKVSAYLTTDDIRSGLNGRLEITKQRQAGNEKTINKYETRKEEMKKLIEEYTDGLRQKWHLQQNGAYDT